MENENIRRSAKSRSALKEEVATVVKTTMSFYGIAN